MAFPLVPGVGGAETGDSAMASPPFVLTLL